MVVCVACEKEIHDLDLYFAESFEAHPGILGPIHPSCYNKAVEAQPDLPWTDPISGQVNYREMAAEIGISDPEDDFEQESEFY